MREKIKYTIKIISIAIVFSLGGAFFFGKFFLSTHVVADNLQFDEEEATIRAIALVKKAVVNILVYDDKDIVNDKKKNKPEMILKGRGTGFIISSDGYIITNKHVVEAASEQGSFRIIMSTGKEYYAQLIAKDPLNDLAVLKIFERNLPFVHLGNSDDLKIGSSVIAIGNVLGLYQNSATKGIVSGLGRSIVALKDFRGETELLDNVIQTDAEINPGNSGGPLIDLRGRVVGINVAIDRAGSAIGFAIPINDARVVINSIIKDGRIVRPRLGLQYIMLTPEIAIDNKLNRIKGAWITTEDKNSSPIAAGGPADKAGLLAGDIIFEINAIKVEDKNTLLSIIQRYKPGDRIGLKIMRGEKVLILVAQLDEFKIR